MKQELVNHFCGWWRDLAIHPQNYFLVLSDDMDSYYSCRYLKRKFGIEIGGFYQFGKGLYLTDAARTSDKKPIYIDCAVVKDGIMCFDNHRTMHVNHMAINPNVITDRTDNENYFRKYCGSTLMLLVALYGGDDLTQTEKEFVIALDSFYVGYYRDRGSFRNINMNWLDLLELKELLLPTLTARNMDYFIDLISRYQLNEKIYIGADGRLFSAVDMPDEKFNLELQTTEKHLNKSDVANMMISDRRIFTAAETFNCSYCADFII